MEEFIKNKKVQIAAIVLLVVAIFFLLFSLIGIPDLPELIHDRQIDYYQSRLSVLVVDKTAAERDLDRLQEQLAEDVVAADKGDIPDSVLAATIKCVEKKKQELQKLEQKINKYEKNLIYAVDMMI
jgi:uncharacterized membrane protein YhiD involved in acid resistance